MSETAIRVDREPGSWVDRFRAFEVVIDGSRVGALRRGESETFPITPGVHNVEMKISWFASPPLTVDVSTGETVWLRCWPAAGLRAVLPWYRPDRWIGLQRLS